MKLKDVGERALLELAREICERGSSVQVGVGDDGAAVGIGEGSLVVTTDMLVEDIHFTSQTPAEQIGKKAVVINLSDLGAMGAEPLGLVYSIGAPKETEFNFISELLNAMNSTARAHDTYIVGGDLNEAKEVIVSGTAFGRAHEGELMLRSGAEVGNFVGVTGELGAASAATKALINGISLEDNDSLKKTLLEPVARVKEGRVLSESGQVTSAIDITDGLAANLWQISRMSEVGLVVDAEELPVSEAARKFAEEQGEDLDNFVLYGGEDFELLFTARPEVWEHLEEKFEELGTRISRLGEVDEGEGVRIRRRGELEKLPDRGYEHFKR